MYYYTIYYGFRKFMYLSEKPIHKAAKDAKVPLDNISSGVIYSFGKAITIPFWDNRKNSVLFFIGRLIKKAENA